MDRTIQLYKLGGYTGSIQAVTFRRPLRASLRHPSNHSIEVRLPDGCPQPVPRLPRRVHPPRRLQSTHWTSVSKTKTHLTRTEWLSHTHYQRTWMTTGIGR